MSSQKPSPAAAGELVPPPQMPWHQPGTLGLDRLRVMRKCHCGAEAGLPTRDEHVRKCGDPCRVVLRLQTPRFTGRPGEAHWVILAGGGEGMGGRLVIWGHKSVLSTHRVQGPPFCGCWGVSGEQASPRGGAEPALDRAKPLSRLRCLCTRPRGPPPYLEPPTHRAGLPPGGRDRAPELLCSRALSQPSPVRPLHPPASLWLTCMSRRPAGCESFGVRVYAWRVAPT